MLTGSDLPRKWIIFQNCAVHFPKSVADKMEDVQKSFAGKNLVMDCMAFMIQCDSIEKVDAVLDKTMRILVTPFEHEGRRFQDDLNAMNWRG